MCVWLFGFLGREWLPWLETTGHQNLGSLRFKHLHFIPDMHCSFIVISPTSKIQHGNLFWRINCLSFLKPVQNSLIESMPTMFFLFGMRLDTSWAYPDKSRWILRERWPCASRCTWNEFVEQLPLFYSSSNRFITMCIIYEYIRRVLNASTISIAPFNCETIYKI